MQIYPIGYEAVFSKRWEGSTLSFIIGMGIPDHIMSMDMPVIWRRS